MQSNTLSNARVSENAAPVGTTFATGQTSTPSLAIVQATTATLFAFNLGDVVMHKLAAGQAHATRYILREQCLSVSATGYVVFYIGSGIGSEEKPILRSETLHQQDIILATDTPAPNTAAQTGSLGTVRSGATTAAAPTLAGAARGGG